MDELDEPTMRKQGRSAALQEILDLLTEMEMEPHRPKPPPKAEPEMPAELAGAEGELPAEAEGEGSLSPEDLEMLRAKLEEMA